MKYLFALIISSSICATVHAQRKTTVLSGAPAMASIKEADLHKDIFELAGDGMRGRRAGTPDEFRAAAWVAQRAQEIGLKPAGDDGTYFQFYNIQRTRTADNGTFQLNGKPLKLWKEVWASQPIDTHLDAQVIWLNSLADTATNIKGKIVALNITAPKPMPAAGMSLWGYRYIALAVRQLSTVFRNKGAAAVILVADDVTESSLAFAGHNYEEGLYQLEGTANPTRAFRPMPIILVRKSFGTDLQQANASIKVDFAVERFLYPSVNVIAKASGTDAVLKDQYVLFSGHHDHDGVGVPIDRDSIWNGADDNASVTVAMLAIGRAWVSKPGKRTALFVWHGAEERGLLGSRYYAAHPTVKKEAIDAVLNGDMIGRNAPDSAALLGSTPPHRNSLALVNMAYTANKQLTNFKIDTSWDDPKHPEGWYFRSDHVPYAQAGIPSIFFTTLLHPDYHTPRDEPQRIDITKLSNMTKWIYATGWLVSQTAEKLVVDK
jgi:hypothetical protein